MPPSLNILLAIGAYTPQKGGASEWLQHYAHWLHRRGHRVCIACEYSDHPEPFTVLTLPPSQHTKNSWKRAAELQRMVTDCKADVVHDTGCLLKSDIFHPLMGSLSHNWVRQLRAFPVGLRLRRFWHVRVWRDVRLQFHQQKHHKMLVACSKPTAADFQQLGCTNGIVIPNSIPDIGSLSVERFRQVREELGINDRLMVLVTATNFYLKGVMTVLRSLARMAPETRKQYKVIFTGNPERKDFKQFIDRHDLSDVCHLTGWVENINDLYQAADVFLHPTYHDAGSLSTLKALAAGCAVVTSRFDGSADWINNGVNGLILKRPDDPAEVMETLVRLHDTGLRNRLGTAARELKPLLNQKHQFQRLEALYYQLPYIGKL